MLPATRFTRHRTLLKAVASDDAFSVRAVLSLPVKDLAGDVVIPGGLDFARHRTDPWVDLEHGLDPAVGRQAVGWACKSLWRRAAGDYSVVKALLDVPGAGTHTLPVGTTYFDRDHALQRQVYFMVRKGDLPGVSLEFRPVAGCMKSLGRSPLENRDAYEFARAEVVRWTHCVEPVCPGALTVLKSLPPELDGLAQTLRDERIEGEPLHPYIVKSLSRFQPTATMIRLEKAMPGTAEEPETVYDPTPDAQADEGAADAGAGGPANNGVSALYAAAQVATDACGQLEADLEHTDSPELFREAMKLCDGLRAFAEKLKAAGDKHDAKLQALKSGKDEPADDPDAEPDMDTDDEGTLKAVRPPYRAVLKAVRGVKRYSLDEVQKGIEAAERQRAEAERPETRREYLERIRVEDPAAYERHCEKARRARQYRAAAE